MKRHYNVAPRYTPGSPAQVDFDTAARVVDEERRAYEPAIQGVFGAKTQSMAQEAGLDGIVEERDERANCWLVTDMISGRRFIRLFPSGESDVKRANRGMRLRTKYGLPLEEDKK